MCKQSRTRSSFTTSHQQADLQQLHPGKASSCSTWENTPRPQTIPKPSSFFPQLLLLSVTPCGQEYPSSPGASCPCCVPSPPRAHPQPPRWVDRGGMRESLKRISAPEALCLSDPRHSTAGAARKKTPSQPGPAHLYRQKDVSVWIAVSFC